MTIPMRDNGVTALYERLSRDDDSAGESNSILNQKKYLEDYARQNGFTNIRHYSDDGYTGTNFDRPAFTQMMSDIEAGLVSTVIVKDMSRFGRNYLEVGFYTEIAFPEKGIRFIAINNSVDSDNPTENEFTPFINLMNDWYAKDTGRKITAIFKSRMAEGLRCSGSIPFGFVRLPGDKQTLVVDPKAASIVRRIFELTASGMNPPAIASLLTSEHVPPPSIYAAQNHPEAFHCRKMINPDLWSPNTVRDILDREEYLGHTILGKSVKKTFRGKNRRLTKPSERMFFPNTHEAIIDQTTWDQAQKMRKRCTRRRPNGTHTHMLFGLTFCPDCGKKLALVQNRTGDQDCAYSFRCSNYRNAYHPCTVHSIAVSSLVETVRLSLKVIALDSLENEETFRAKLTAQWAEQHSVEMAEWKKELSAATKRINELDKLIRGLYEDRQLGRMPARQVDRLMMQYDQEQEELEAKAAELQQKIDDTKSGKTEPDKFLKAIRKYRDFEELTPEMAFELIERIEVHQRQRNDETGEWSQRIDIRFAFIGEYKPNPERMAIEIAQICEKKEAAKAARKAERTAQAKAKEKERRVQRRLELEQRAKVDPEAAAQLAADKEKKHEYNVTAYQKRKAREIEKAIGDGTYVAPNPYASMSQSELAQIAGTDPGAAEELEKRRAYGRAKQAEYRAKAKERMQTDPEYAAKAREKAARYNATAKAKHDSLVERAKTDEAAAAELADYTARRRASVRACEERKKQRAESDPVFAEEYKAKTRAKNQHYSELAKQKRKELRESAATDPQAAEELAAQRAKATEYVLSSRKRIKENAATDPAAAAKREHYLEYRRQYDTERKHNLIAAAQTDPLAAERLAMERRNAVEATQRWKAKRKEAAATAAI